jgi:hypothetical protein
VEPNRRSQLTSRQARAWGWLVVVALSAIPVYLVGVITLPNAVFTGTVGLVVAVVMFRRARSIED